MSTSGQSEPGASAAPPQGGVANSLEQVREILFGSHHRDFTRRLARTEAHVAAQAEELRSEARRRLDVLEAHVRKEYEVLAASLSSQEAAQREALDNVARESRESVGSLEQRVKKLEELMGRTQREFREQLLAQAKSFIDEVQRTRAELTAAVEHEVVEGWGEPAEAPARPEPAPEEAVEHEAWERRPKAA